MRVTDVKIRKLANDGKMRAVVSVTFDDCFVVHDIKIIEGLNGLFVAMPSRRVGPQDFRDIAHPINQKARQDLTAEIFRAYREATGETVVEDPFLA